MSFPRRFLQRCAVIALVAAFTSLPGTAVAAQDPVPNFDTMGGLIPDSFQLGDHLDDGLQALPAPGASALDGFDEPLGDFDVNPAVVAVVPEPSSFALMLSGIVALTFFAGRRRRA